MNENLIMDFNAVMGRENDLIPAGTFLKVRLSISPGGYGAEGLLSKTRNTNIWYLKTMLIVVEGIYTLRKIYHRFAVQGPDPHDSWVEKGQRQLRMVLESARNILPTDTSEAAQNLRKVQSYNDFNGLTFCIKAGVETPKNPVYAPANCIQRIITPDCPEYQAEPIDMPHPNWPL